MMTGQEVEDAAGQAGGVGQARVSLGDLQQPAVQGQRQAAGARGRVERENQHRNNALL